MTTRQSIFAPLPLGSIKPEGWMKRQLRIQADGLSGHLEEHWEDVGPNNGWLGGRGESWERGPYYLDGFLPLAYLLEDEQLIAKANKWVEWALSSQREDGMFGPTHITTVNNDVNKRFDWWHLTIMLKALTQYAEVSSDERVIPFLERFFRFLDETVERMPLTGWAHARGADLVLSILWLYDRTSDPALVALAEKIRRQSMDWSAILSDFPFQRKYEGKFDHRTHVVNVAMALKAPAIAYRLTGQEEHREAVYRGMNSLMTFHGQAHGMFSGDEWLSGTHPSQGVELCAVVEYMFSLEHTASIMGDGMFGDVLERVAYNALPAAVSADWTSHQYDQQVNQVVCNVAKRNWVNGNDANTFGLTPNFGCCTANMHQGWPKLLSHSWMSSKDGGLAVIAYAPCSVRTVTGSGARITAQVITDYPFKENVRIRLTMEAAETFPLYLRIPGWCKEAELRINGQAQRFKAGNGYARIERQWVDQDEIELTFPIEVKRENRSNYAVNVVRGPLVYVLPIAESWIRLRERERFHDWELYPASPWKYGLLGDSEVEVKESDVPDQPYIADEAPVKITVQGQLLPEWALEMHSAASPPMQPRLDSARSVSRLELVPYGCARLRIGEFPVVAKGFKD